jgi:hypothetical protein
MKEKLIKDHDEYMLINDERLVIATTDASMLEVTDKMKLSKQNCDEVFGVVNVDNLAENHPLEVSNASHGFGIKDGIVYGFNKAMELNKDKLFTLEDMKRAIDKAKQGSVKETHNGYGRPTEPRFVLDDLSYDEIIQSLQQPTEIEVEIEMKKVVDETKVIGAVKGVKGSGDKITTYKSVPKLDENGCLILKRI